MWKYSEDEALFLLIDAQLSKKQYTTIRLQAKEKWLKKAKGANIYPAYNNIRAAKERCYPDPVTATVGAKSVCRPYSISQQDIYFLCKKLL